MGNISPHFSKHEIECQCGCGFNILAPALIYVLEAIRERFDAELLINQVEGSACRCKKHNAEIGGKADSRHLPNKRGECEAADIKLRGKNKNFVSPVDVADYAENLLRDRGGVGRYNTRVHVDVRGYKARWDG